MIISFYTEMQRPYGMQEKSSVRLLICQQLLDDVSAFLGSSNKNLEIAPYTVHHGLFDYLTTVLC